ncbi:glutaredoxin [Bradyrhizobium diazoefficiens]|nr:MauE/DoxX family redox-associated membrane protein [Bradyrhizobium diazoefficiens]QQO20626.1 glutaredoxin [Bradyrhizobium diazoefficiens]
MDQTPSKTATLYRMVTPEHICPFGLKSLDLLQRQGFEVEDHQLKSRAETDAFMASEHVKTTPQTFIDGKRVGGYDDLRRFFHEPVADPNATSYQPVVAVFATAFAMALAATWAATGTLMTARAGEWFVAFSMCILAILKLQNLDTFSNMFLGYDLLAQRVVRYAYVYPFGEAIAGVLMIAGGPFKWIAIPIALFIGGIGAASVFKAVYVDRRELKCACVGGSSKVPLGFVSLTENLMMVAMAIWMAVR